MSLVCANTKLNINIVTMIASAAHSLEALFIFTASSEYRHRGVQADTVLIRRAPGTALGSYTPAESSCTCRMVDVWRG